MFRFLLLTICVIILFAADTAAQSHGSIVGSGAGQSARERHEQDVDKFRRDMQRDLEIKREEESFKETFERAKENSQLGAELLESFTRNRGLSQDDLKKLSRMEKLSRQIRGRAGGSDDKLDLEDAPRELMSLFKRLAETADELSRKIEKMTRHIVSASVIQQANELVELIRHARSHVK